jgi:hypothetical protein
MHEPDPLKVFLSAFGLSSLAGLAQTIRTERKLTWVKVLGSMLYSGLAGLILALLWWKSYSDNPHYLVGLCLLAGFGSKQIVDLLFSRLRRLLGDPPGP